MTVERVRAANARFEDIFEAGRGRFREGMSIAQSIYRPLVEDQPPMQLWSVTVEWETVSEAQYTETVAVLAATEEGAVAHAKSVVPYRHRQPTEIEATSNGLFKGTVSPTIVLTLSEREGQLSWEVRS